jgi:hypothetical protein
LPITPEILGQILAVHRNAVSAVASFILNVAQWHVSDMPLNIDIICANSSQAKGRVERANGTLQDRLVKEMRLCGIDTIAAGNAFLPAFIDDYNARFAKAPLEDRDVHRPLAGHDDLDDAFAWKEERTVSMNLTLQYDQVLFILEPTGIARSLARKRVTVIDYPDGRLAIRYDGVDLPYRTFDKRPQVNQAAIVENKRLGPILAYIAEQQKQLDMSRSTKAPRRLGRKNHMFKIGYRCLSFFTWSSISS